jgi:hypothetical protein
MRLEHDMQMDRRKAERKETNNFFGVYHKETSKYVGRLCDLSTSGLLIQAKDELAVGTHYEFRIDLPKPVAQQSYLVFSAECVWCRKPTESSIGFDAGFKIENIDFEAAKTIQYLMNDPIFTEAEEQPRVTMVEVR